MIPTREVIIGGFCFFVYTFLHELYNIMRGRSMEKGGFCSYEGRITTAEFALYI